MTQPPSAAPADPLAIRRATAADATRLSTFAAAVFCETFAADNTAEDMAHYLASAFSPALQAAEIAAPSGDVLLVEASGTGPEAPLLGYAHLVQVAAPACVTGARPIELKRFYVEPASHGRGIARVLMAAVLDAARARDAGTLWLGVWERNARAIAFYGKHAFHRVGEQRFVLGRDVQTDWIMQRAL